MTIFTTSLTRCSSIGERLNISLIRRNLAKASTFVLPSHTMYPTMISLVGEQHAQTVMTCIEKHVSDGDGPVIQIRAGDGHLTKKLLAAGVKQLHVCERRKAYQSSLQEIISQHQERCALHSRTIADIFLEDCNIPAFNSTYLKESLPFTCKKAWKDSPSFKLIGASSNGKVLIAVLAHLSKNMMFFGMGRPQFILAVPRISWDKLMRNPKSESYHDYQTAGLLFPDCYEQEVLGNIPPPVHYSQRGQTVRASKEEFIIVSITPRKDLEDVTNPELLEEYLFFATQTMNGNVKHSYIIPTLEKWLPGCGKELVISGVNCLTKFKELSAKEALKVFTTWKSHSNYNSSIFMYEFKDYFKYNKH